jgi:hypothetical protein
MSWKVELFDECNQNLIPPQEDYADDLRQILIEQLNNYNGPAFSFKDITRFYYSEYFRGFRLYYKLQGNKEDKEIMFF